MSEPSVSTMYKESGIKVLIVKRSSIKGQITKFKNYLDKITRQSQLTGIEVAELSLKVSRFESLSAKYDELQTQIELINADTLDEELDERERIEQDIILCTAMAKNIIEEQNELKNLEQDKRRRESLFQDAHCGRDHNNENSITLPQIQIAKFDADTPKVNNASGDVSETSANYSNKNSNQVILSTAQVYILNPTTNEPLKVRALLDSGSQSSFITKSLQQKLAINSNPISVNVIGIGHSDNQIKESCVIQLKSIYNNFKTKLNCLVLHRLTGNLPKAPINIQQLNIPSHLHLADPDFNQPAPIDILIGADLFCFGWLIGGPISYQAKQVLCNNSVINDNFQNENKIDNLLAKFWELEELPQKTILSETELACSNDSEELNYIQNSVAQELDKGCFKLRKYKSNLCSIFDNCNLNLQENIMLNEASSTLGLGWNPNNDMLNFPVNIPPLRNTITKRSIMSDAFKIFDPLGLLSPYIMQPKLMLQKLWKLKSDWDQPVPIDIENAWRDFSRDLLLISNFQIPRFVLSESPQIIDIHCFSDASLVGYGACIYARVTSSNNHIEVKLLCSKSKVAPLKPVSIPRLELCAALLSSRLGKAVINSIRFTPNSVTYWSDSSVVLGWLSSDSTRLKTFVANRVGEIQENTKLSAWRYVPTDHNPADLISRATTLIQLQNSDLWWHGPTFLTKDQNEWPALKSCDNVDLPDVKFTATKNILFYNMSARKYKSGAEKRKLQFSREQERNKCAKIETFFKSEHINANEIAINPLKNVKEGILCEENLTDGSKKSQNEEKNTSDENMQDFENQKKNTNDENVQYLDFQQPSGSSENEIGVQQKGGNTDTEVERNLENIKFEFEKYVDVGLWPDLLNNDFINFVLSHEMTDFQNKDPKNIYSASMKKYKEQNRSFSNRYFTRKMKNGQLLERSWLCYSKRVGTVFCLTCKLFSKTPSQYTTGFTDWKHIGFCLENHENSNEHKNSMLVWLTRKENKSVLDKQLQEQLNKETEYYHNVLKRVIAVLKFLSIRGLALRGSEEVFGSPHNGNFMGALELLAEFDPFIREHIEQRELRPNPVISYLSKTVYEEIIEIMGKQIIKQIITEINNDDTKYYSIMMDSTPDLSDDDQLAIVLRYCFRGKVFGENDDEKVDFRKEARNLFNKLAKLETAILIVFWEEILERFNVVNKKVQSPGLDIGEGNKLIVSLKEFVKNIRQQSDQKLKEYEEKAKKLSTSVGTDYSDINKRRITLKFSDKSTDKVSVNCAEKFKRDTLNVALDKMIMDLNNRSQAYETYSKKFKFLMDLQDKNQEHIDLESVRNIIDYYPNDVDEHLVNECIQLKSYLLQSKTESYTSCSEIFWLIYEKKLVDVFPNCYTILKIF
ncbi:unnamed protein product, partial [Brenthis ino]